MSKKSIFITRKIPDEGMSILDNNKFSVDFWDSECVIPREDLLSRVAGVEGILCTLNDKIDRELLDAAGSQLRMVSSLSTGTGNIDVFECRKRHIHVYDVSHFGVDAAAEYTVALILTVARRLLEGLDAVLNGEWGLWKPMWICGFELVGRTLGFYGMGPVGLGVARRLMAFNIGRVLFYQDPDRNLKIDPNRRQVSELLKGLCEVKATVVDLDKLAEESDILCVCCESRPLPEKAVDSYFLSLMKDSAILVSTTQGSVIDVDALDHALKAGRPLRAALDWTDPEPLPPDHPLRNNPKCLISPHLATSTRGSVVRMAKAAATNVYIDLLKTGKIKQARERRWAPPSQCWPKRSEVSNASLTYDQKVTGLPLPTFTAH